ncbi:hypothetical protein I7I48_02712 [Histoplasma ohiense]|nr:hypothetical protein I7I48_02712 [Histoplasma ohiense (nom. inval.)]
MSMGTTRTPKIEETETGSVDSRGGSGTISATEKNNSIDLGTKMAAKVQRSGDQQQVDSTSSTRPTSPVPATQLWESVAHSYVCCEETPAGKTIHITLSKNPLNLQPSKVVPDWTQLIRTALAESPPTIPFQQMDRPLSQEDMSYIRKRLEEYTNKMRWQTHKLDAFDCAVILADARTLFSYIALLESMVASQAQQEENDVFACWRPGGIWKAAATSLGIRMYGRETDKANGSSSWRR